ncbi:MAG: AAA domain-containing protein [bacterium]|nr:AAA domain-containing protein [bacterium]
MKVTIPREEIDRIMKQYECDEAKAIKAYLEARKLSEETFEEELTRHLGPRSIDDKWQTPIFNPRQIKEHLDKYVIGQEKYKKRLSIASAFHFSILKHLSEFPEVSKVKRFRKKNTIIAGPSGSGKTYCAEVLGDLLEVPTLIVDSTDYTEAGYVGKSADDMIRELIDMAPGGARQEKADFVSKHGGIIFVDEIDKKAKDRGVMGHDISREGFQRAVLKLIERKHVTIDNPYSPVSQFKEAMRQQGKGSRKQDNMISTEKILFIVGGSFQRPHNDLESIVKERIKHKGGKFRKDGSVMVMGFSTEEAKEKDQVIWNYYKEANADDYIRFGLLPELVGRIPIRSHVNLLSKNDLVRIMRDTEDSIIHQYELEFKSFGIDLSIDEKAIDFVAEQAENKKTGARALVSVWENILTDFQYELPASNFKELVITKDLCQTPQDALLEMLERSPFVDFIEGFNNEHGIRLTMGQEEEQYVQEYAKEHKMQVSDALKKLLQGASSLNYMNIEGKFNVTREMLEDPKYFDDLFTEWYRETHKEETPKKELGKEEINKEEFSAEDIPKEEEQKVEIPKLQLNHRQEEEKKTADQ